VLNAILMQIVLLVTARTMFVLLLLVCNVRIQGLIAIGFSRICALLWEKADIRLVPRLYFTTRMRLALGVTGSA